MKKITIAIDGHSSTGKSTLAKQLAKALHYIYIDTGAMYRAVTLFALEQGFISESSFNSDKLIDNLKNIYLSFKLNTDLGFAEMYLNDENVETKIRSIQVSNFVSKIAAMPQVRSKLVQQQKMYGKDKGVVMDGRDIGTVVFPDAELKIFMTASAQIRAERRFLELQALNPQITYNQVLQNVTERDEIDSTRKDSPLTIAHNAIVIDNTFLTKEEQFQTILQLAQHAINAVN